MPPPQGLTWMSTALGGLLFLAAGCATDSADSERPAFETVDPTAGTGGTASAGGTTSAGGTASSGGMSSGSTTTSGGASSGGTASSGGATGSGGTTTSGGATSAGGASTLPAGVLLFDDFEDGAAQGFIADTDDGTNVGNWGVVPDGAGKVYEERTEYSDTSLTVGGDLAWTDQILEAKVKFASSSNSSPLAYLAVRLQSKDRYYFLELHANETNGSLKVRKRVDGSTNDVISSFKTGVPVGIGTWYTIGLSAVGSTITASFNGTVIGTATDTDLTNGGIAVGVVDAVADFDDVKVTAP